MTNEEAADILRAFRTAISRNSQLYTNDVELPITRIYTAKIMYGNEFIDALNQAINTLEEGDD